MRKPKPGRKSKVTAALVRRVSNHVARGIPIHLALALTGELTDEPVTLDAYERQLRRHPKLRAIQARAKLKFLDKAIDAICSQPGPMLRWYLERRFAHVFCPQEEDEKFEAQAERDTASETQTIDSSEEVLEEAR
jgi:hypothetical protein